MVVYVTVILRRAAMELTLQPDCQVPPLLEGVYMPRAFPYAFCQNSLSVLVH